MLYCACGCGERTIKPKNKYKRGHYVRTKECRMKSSKMATGRRHSKKTIEKMRKSHEGKRFSEEHKRKIGMANKGKHLSKETKRKISESNKGKTKSEETKREMSRTRRGKGNNMYGKKHSDETKEKIRRKSKKCWQNPEYIRRQMRLRGVQPNKIETSFNELLNKWFPKEWRYVGDGEVILGGKCPDFININGQKKIIELFGNYWHGKERTGRTKRQEENQKINHFIKYGYKTLIVWQIEFKNIKKLQKKVLDFQEK